MELVEKTELIRRLSFYALSKIHLDSQRSFCKILHILTWDINLNQGPVHRIQNENLLQVVLFHDCNFSRNGVDYNLNNFTGNVSKNDWDVFKKEECTLYMHKHK